MLFLAIVENIIIPILLLVTAGFYLHKKHRFNLGTLSKINMNYLIPSVIITNLYHNTIQKDVLFSIIIYLALFFILMHLICVMWIKLLKMPSKLAGSFKNSVVLYNSNSYGLVVNNLVFRSDPVAITMQIIILTVQNILTFTYGLYNVGGQDKKKR